jgi:hypothetical protein
MGGQIVKANLRRQTREVKKRQQKRFEEDAEIHLKRNVLTFKDEHSSEREIKQR